jgi:hypothetical protein
VKKFSAAMENGIGKNTVNKRYIAIIFIAKAVLKVFI